MQDFFHQQYDTWHVNVKLLWIIVRKKCEKIRKFWNEGKADFLAVLTQKIQCLFQRLCEKPVTRHFAISTGQKERPRLLFGGEGRTISSDDNHGGWWMMACRVYRCLFWKNPRNRKVDICAPSENCTFETNISESWGYAVVSRCFKHVANTFNIHPCEIQHGKTLPQSLTLKLIKDFFLGSQKLRGWKNILVTFIVK